MLSRFKPSAPREALWLLLGSKHGPRSRWIATHRVTALERMEITVSCAAFAGESGPWLGGTGRIGGIRMAWARRFHPWLVLACVLVAFLAL